MRSIASLLATATAASCVVIPARAAASSSSSAMDLDLVLPAAPESPNPARDLQQGEAPPAPQCHPEYIVGGPYSPGDRVSRTITALHGGGANPVTSSEETYNYECVGDDRSVHCNADTFIPFGWMRELVQCTGTVDVSEQIDGNATATQ